MDLDPSWILDGTMDTYTWMEVRYYRTSCIGTAAHVVGVLPLLDSMYYVHRVRAAATLHV